MFGETMGLPRQSWQACGVSGRTGARRRLPVSVRSPDQGLLWLRDFQEPHPGRSTRHSSSSNNIGRMRPFMRAPA